MAFEGTTEEQMQKAAATILADMEKLAARMRAIIATQPPHDLLGYIQAQRVLRSMFASDEESRQDMEERPDDVINDTQFLLEYVHAVLASDSGVSEGAFDEAACVELGELSKKLRTQSIIHAMATSVDIKDGAFGPNTAELQFRAKSNWVMLRGNRYQVLEGEFFAYVLAPHDDILRDAYGVGAGEIAMGFQDMADAASAGHADAFEEVAKQFDAAQAYADAHSQWATGAREFVEGVREMSDAAKQAHGRYTRAIDLNSKMLQGG